jgi:ABC-type transport system substrate-binding protein
MITLTFPIPDLPIVVDPARVQHVSHVMIARQLHANLVSVSQGGTVTPELARGWSLSKDKKTLIFSLKSATFSNGEKIRPYHVVSTFERLALSKAAVASDLNFIQGFEASLGRKTVTPEFGVVAKGNEEVEFKLESFSPLVFQILGMPDCGIVPSGAVDEFPVRAGMVSSGAWRIVRAEVKSLVIEKWRPSDHEAKSYPKRIEFVKVNSEGRVHLARAGKIDSLADTSLSTTEVKDFQNKGWTHATPDTSRFLFARVNPSIDSARRLEIAEAFAEFRAEFRDPEGAFKAMHGVFPPFLEGSLSHVDYAPMLQEAQASTPPRKKGTRQKSRSLRITYLENNARLETLLPNLVAKLKEFDFEFQQQPLPLAELLKKIKTKDFDVLLSTKAMEYPDAFAILSYFRSGYDQNDFNISSEDLDSALTAVVRTDDRSETLRLYRDIQRSILSSFLYLPMLYGSGASGLWSPRVKSAPATPLGVHTLRFEQVEMN